MKAALVLSILTLGTSAALAGPAAAQASPAAAACAPEQGLSFVCGLVNVEDLLPVAGGRWLVAGSYKEGSAGLYLIDTAAKTARPAAISIAAKPDPIYGGCAPPDLKRLSTHGLDVRPDREGTATVYAVNHGGREAIEVFRLDTARGSAEWVGCVLAPSGASVNSVAGLPDRSIVFTKFLDTNDKDGIRTVMAAKVNGVVYRWAPGKGTGEVPGSRFSGDNGLVASPDGQTLYVNAYGTKEVWRIPLSGQGARASVTLDFYPDNLRWAPDGTLFVTGQYLTPPNLAGPNAWATVRLDPASMKVTPLVKTPGFKAFDKATSTVQVGRTLWFGTFRGDRVAYRPAP